MTALLRTRVTAVWALLVAVTCVAWALGDSKGLEGGSADVATVAVLAIAFFKVRLIGLQFMELRGAPRGLRLGFEAWVVGVGGLLVVLYLAG